MEFSLKEAQIERLIHLRNHKRAFLIKAFLGFMVLATVTIFYPLGVLLFHMKLANDSQYIYQIGGVIVFAIILYGLINYFFLRTIRPLNKDIKNKVGSIEKHQIIRKQHFPITNDYFFFFAEIKIPNIPVDPLTFKYYQPGDYFTIHRAKYSKVVFEDISRQEINTEYDFDDTGISVLEHFID